MTSVGSGRQWPREIIGRLDRVRRVPSAVLAALVRRRGLCMRPVPDAEPAWRDAHLTDRELAEELCRGCPVPNACLELELRTAGPRTVGVWGGLPQDDRRALYRHWVQQRRRARHDHSNHGTENREGGRQR
jgi:WhiB family transcriptional regulator, redox-sensing transcriptional regulator